MQKWITSTGFWAVLLFLATSGCNRNAGTSENKGRDTVYSVSGAIQGLDSGWVRIAYYFDDKRFTDSAKVENGSFRFNGKVDFPQFAYLTIEGQPGLEAAGFFLENGNTIVSARKDSLSSANISGTAAQEEFKKYAKEMKPFDDRMTQLNKAYENIHSTSFRKSMDSLDNVYYKIVAEKLIAINRYVQAHPESFVAAMEIQNNYSYDPKVDQLDSAYGFLGESVKETSIGKKIFEMLEVARSTDIGHSAPDFSLNDVNDKPLALSSLRGKVLLVDFWASWCGPCREENPNIVEAYKKYHAKGFDILGVSLDTSKEKWLKAIKKDNLTWNHVSDLKGWKSSAGELYGIRGIPMSFLLDKNGVIIGKNLRGESLTRKLEEIL